MVNGIRIESMDLVYIPIQTDRSTKETGSTTRNMERELTTTKTVTNTSEIGSKTKRTATECLNTPPEQSMTESGSMIALQIREKSSMPIRISTKVTS